MSQDIIFDRVKTLIKDNLGVENPDTIVPEATFATDLGADSLDIVEFVMALEEEFHIEIPDEAAQEIDTVQKAVEYITEATKK